MKTFWLFYSVCTILFDGSGNVDDDCGNDNVRLEEAAVYSIICQCFYKVFIILFAKSNILSLLNSRYLVMLLLSSLFVQHHLWWPYCELN